MTTQTEAPARFTATHAALSAALKAVALGVADSPQLPTLNGVLVETRDGEVILRGFDFETSVSVRVDGEGETDGRSLINFFDVKDVLAAAVVGEKPAVAARTRVTVDGGVLSTPELAVPLNTMDPAEYPAFPPDAPAQVTVDGTEWFRQVARVLPAAGRDMTLPALTCVHVRIADGMLRLSTTDRYRLTVAELDATGGGETETTALVPAWLLEKVSKLLGKHTGPVTFGVHPKEYGDWFTLTVGAVTVTVRSPEDNFPKVWELIPSEETPAALHVDREALVRAVRKSAALSKAKGDKTGRVRLEFALDGVVTVSPDLDDPEQQGKVRGVDVAGVLLADDLPGEPLKANGVYLLDALGTFAGETVTVHVQRPGKPFLLTDGPSVAGEGYRHMLMPARIR